MSWELGDYCTLNDVRVDQSIKATATGDDPLLEDLIEQSSREIDSFCGRRFYGLSETRYYDALEAVDGLTLLLDEDFATIATITLGTGDTLDEDEYVLLPLNTTPKHQIKLKSGSSQWWAFQDSPEAAISVAGSTGYTAGTMPPRPITRACVALVRYHYRKRQAPFESAGMGDLGAYGVSAALPEDVQRILMPYVKYRVGNMSAGGYW